MSTASPPMPKTAIELLTNREDRERPFLDTIWGPTIGSILGFGLYVYINVAHRRPLLSGIHRHILCTGIGGYGGYIAYKWRADYLATRDAQLRHYVELHPESFKMSERKKFGEILNEWVPIR